MSRKPARPTVIGPDVPLLLRKLRQDADAWARGRIWQGRLLVLLYLVYAGWRRWGDREAWSWFDGLTLLLHELGHVLFVPFGEFLMIAGGSITQILAPIGAFIVFVRQRDYFALCVAGSWLAMSLFNLAVYVADARAMALPLVGIGTSDPLHDWHYLLSEFNALRWDELYAGRIETLAVLVWLTSCLAGGWLLWRMFCSPRQEAWPSEHPGPGV